MKLDINEWRRQYDNAQVLGKRLKDSRFTQDKKGKWHAPKLELTEEQQKNLEEQITDIIKGCGNYLDACGITRPKPLWIYDEKDKSTWASDPLFAYGHLIKRTWGF